MKKRTEKLSLKKETLRTLTNDKLARVNGGDWIGQLNWSSNRCLANDNQYILNENTITI